MKLSPSQIAQFYDEGYLMIEEMLDHDDLQPVIDEINEAIDVRARELYASGDLKSLYEDEEFETRLSRITTETEKLYWSICNGQLSGPGIFRLITNPKLLDIAESFVGPEIIASSVYRIRPKIPGFDHGVVPWHQDSGYFEPYCDNDLVLTIWLPMVDATPERGCLQVIRGTHRNGIAKHYRNIPRRYLEILPENLPTGEIVTVPVPLGGVLLLTNRTPHQSISNVTDVIRWSADLRYQGAHLPNNYRVPDAPVQEVREDGIPVACYPPEADFLVRSRQHPKQVVIDCEEFHRIRKTYLAQPVTQRWETLVG